MSPRIERLVCDMGPRRSVQRANEPNVPACGPLLTSNPMQPDSVPTRMILHRGLPSKLAATPEQDGPLFWQSAGVRSTISSANSARSFRLHDRQLTVLSRIARARDEFDGIVACSQARQRQVCSDLLPHRGWTPRPCRCQCCEGHFRGAGTQHLPADRLARLSAAGTTQARHALLEIPGLTPEMAL